MNETLMQILNFAAPLAVGIVTSTCVPSIIGSMIKKKFDKVISDMVNDTKYNSIEKRLDRIEKEILEMRGKVK